MIERPAAQLHMVMGDHNMNGSDFRVWATNVIGKSFFLYRPVTDRFSVSYHR